MKRVAGFVIAVVLALLALILVPQGMLRTHGHCDERLEVTVRVVEGETGRPLSGAVVAIVRYRSMMHREDFEWHYKRALEQSQQDDNWDVFRVSAKRTTDEPVTTIISSVYVTRWWIGGLMTDKKVSLPRILRVHHPEHGCTIVPIAPETPLTEGDQPNTWRLDLGTVQVPR